MATWTSSLYKKDGHLFSFIKPLGRLVGKGALPSQRTNARKMEQLNKLRNEFTNNNKSKCYSFPEVTTIDNVRLDTIEIIGTNQNEDIKKRNYVIYFLGQSNYYELHLEELQHIADKTPATIIAFNYRSVGRSSGDPPSHQNDLLNDGSAQIESLIKREGITKEQIVLFGHSLGGGLATILTAKHKLSLINDRSYDTLIHAALQMFISRKVAFGVGCLLGFFMASIFVGISHASLPLLGLSALLAGASSIGINRLQPKVLRILLSPIFHLVMGLGGWEINAVESFKKIPAGKKVVYIIKSSKHPEGHEKYSDLAKWCYDKVMGSASLGHALRFLRKEIFPKTSTEFSEEYLALKPYKMVFNDEQNKKLPEIELKKKKNKLHSAKLEDLLVRPEPKKNRLSYTATAAGRISPTPQLSNSPNLPPSPTGSTDSIDSIATTASEKNNSISAEIHFSREIFRLCLSARNRLDTLSSETAMLNSESDCRSRSSTSYTNNSAS
jgi:hypothetical protein